MCLPGPRRFSPTDNQFTTPPPIFRRSSDSDDIVSMKLLETGFIRVARRLVVISRRRAII
jgi:hypothetical protein